MSTGRTECSGGRRIQRPLGAVRKGLVCRTVVYALVCVEKDNGAVGGSEIIEWRRVREDVRTAAPRHTLQEMPESMLVVERGVSRRSSLASPEWTRGATLGIGVFPDRQRKSSGETANVGGGRAKRCGNGGTAVWLKAKVEERACGKECWCRKGGKIARPLVGGAKREAKEVDIRY